MHDEAMDYIRRFRTAKPVDVLEIGSRDINGSPRQLFPRARWHGIDLYPGPGVDEVADGATYRIHKPYYDFVICAEVFEHTPTWPDIVQTMYSCLKPGGRAIITTAGPTRPPHSAFSGHQLREDSREYYANISAERLYYVMCMEQFVDVDVNELGDDVRATGVVG